MDGAGVKWSFKKSSSGLIGPRTRRHDPRGDASGRAFEPFGSTRVSRASGVAGGGCSRGPRAVRLRVLTGFDVLVNKSMNKVHF